MAAPAQSSIAAGATDAGGAWTFTAGTSFLTDRIVIFQVLQDGATNGAVTFTTWAQVKNLAGTANSMTQIIGANTDGSFPVGASGEARQFLWIGRMAADNFPSGSGGNSTSEDLYARWYSFTNGSTGTTLATVIENGTAGATSNQVGTGTTATSATVTTLGADRLVLELLAINDDLTPGEYSADLTMGARYADAGGTDGSVNLAYQTATTAATYASGLTVALGASGAWGNVGFALIGTTAGGGGSTYTKAGYGKEHG